MKVVWSPTARRGRDGIFEYIANDNPVAAVRMDQRFDDATEELREFPFIGRAGKVQGTRELLPHESYRLVYTVNGDDVVILAVVHTARQWPPLP